ncbi:MAG: choice-of-anchor D domain-containing protein [Planctomycetes bacterium]|nr:choice-of-anchor D domain-containing protein [Planctomycetota bacterium]
MGGRVNNYILILFGIVLVTLITTWGCKNPLLDFVKKDVEEYNAGEPSEPGGPEINVKQNSTDIPSGGSYDFGNTTIGIPKDIIFDIENLGDAELRITNLELSSSTVFSFTSQPFSPIAPGAATSFTIRFNPETEGLQSATVTITNNDSDENHGERI